MNMNFRLPGQGYRQARLHRDAGVVPLNPSLLGLRETYPFIRFDLLPVRWEGVSSTPGTMPILDPFTRRYYSALGSLTFLPAGCVGTWATRHRDCHPPIHFQRRACFRGAATLAEESSGLSVHLLPSDLLVVAGNCRVHWATYKCPTPPRVRHSLC